MASDGEHEIQTKYHGASENWLEDAGKAQPFGRLLDPKEVAKAVTFLASDDSGMMTGSVVNFDQSVWGGYPFAPPQPADKMEIKQFNLNTFGHFVDNFLMQLPNLYLKKYTHKFYDQHLQ